MTPETVRLQLLRPGIDHAIARSREKSSAIPAPIRKIVGFRQLPATAVTQVAKAIESNNAYRQFVAAKLPGGLDRPSVLWLTRPEGWEHELDGLVQAEHRRASAIAQALQEDEDEAEGQELSAQQEVLAGRVAALESTNAELAAELRDVRSERRAEQERAEAAEARSAELEDERAEAIRQLKDQERITARLGLQRRELQDALAAEDAARPPDPALAEQRTAIVTASDDATAGLHQLTDLLRAAEATVADVAAQLANARAAVMPREEQPTSPVDAPVEPRASAPRRTPARLPGGVWEDTADALRHLLTVPDLRIVVDGYNVSKRRWGNLALEAQRTRLATGLGALAARAARDVVLVWDGADDVAPTTERAPRGVTVRYTSAGQEADDWIIDYCRDTGAAVPLVVVTNDRRVRDGARRHGANWCGVDVVLDELAR